MIFTTCADNITDCDGHNVTLVAMNSTSFPCPVDNVNCESMTMNDLIRTRSASFRKICTNEFVFQSGSYDVKKINPSSLTLLASRDLVIWGQNNVTITCVDDSMIGLKGASNVTIREIQFQNCSISLETNKQTLHSVIVVTNSIFNSSRLILSGTDSNTLSAILQSINLINGSFTLKKADHVNITGQGSSRSITCTNSEFFLEFKPYGTIKLSDVKVHDCSSIVIKSRSKIVTFETNNTLFSNSCLKFEATRTRSSVDHDMLINMTNTKIKRCSCSLYSLFQSSI